MSALVFALLLAAPAAQAAAALLRPAAVRDAAMIAMALVGAAASIAAVQGYAFGAREAFVLAAPLPGLALAFEAEPYGLTIAALLCGLNALTTIYAVAYRRTREEDGIVAGDVFGALSVCAAVAIAISANLFAFFVGVVALGLTGFALIGAHAPQTAARLQMGIMLGSAVAFLLPAIIWTSAVTGVIDFAVGGVIAPDTPPWVVSTLIVLFALGLGGVGLVPLHRWIVLTSPAPAPAAALIQSIAIAPAATFGFVKICVGVFGAKALTGAGGADAVLVVALATMIFAPLMALTKTDLNVRLSYSTVAAGAGVVAAAVIAAPAAQLGAVLALISHGLAKTTLLMGAGAVETATGRASVDALRGLGRRMPWTFAAMAAATLSIAGLAPAAGAWTLLWSVGGAASAQHVAAVVVFAIAAMLNFAALGPALFEALIGPVEINPFSRPDGASLGCIAPTVIGGLATLSLVVFVDPIARFLIVGLTP